MGTAWYCHGGSLLPKDPMPMLTPNCPSRLQPGGNDILAGRYRHDKPGAGNPGAGLGIVASRKVGLLARGHFSIRKRLNSSPG